MEYSPAGFVLVEVGTPVATLLTVTVAPATMAPEESVTMPRVAPVTVCAKAEQWGRKRTSAHASDFEISFIIASVERDIIARAAAGTVVRRRGRQREPQAKAPATFQRSIDRG